MIDINHIELTCCPDRKHGIKPPPMDGYVAVDFMEGRRDTFLFSEAPVSVTSDFVVIHLPDGAHIRYPMHVVYRLTERSNSEKWHRDFEKWYSDEHGVSLKSMVEFESTSEAHRVFKMLGIPYPGDSNGSL